MGTKVIRRALELMLNSATTQDDWDVVKYAIDDYIDEGYNIKDMVQTYNKLYQEWITQTNMN